MKNILETIAILICLFMALYIIFLILIVTFGKINKK